MKKSVPHREGGKSKIIPFSRAFSLVEVTLALGIIAFALLAIVGLIPIGMKSAREAVEDTRTGLILQDAANRTRSFLGAATTVPAAPATVTWWYDSRGGVRPQPQAWPDAETFYRVDVRYGPLASALTNVGATNLLAATISIGWPVNTATGAIEGGSTNRSGTTHPFYLRIP